MLRVVTGQPTLFEAFRGTDAPQGTSEEYWAEITGRQSKETRTRFQKNKRKKAAWIEAEMAPTDLAPRTDNDMYWFPVDLAHDTELVCLECGSITGTERDCILSRRTPGIASTAQPTININMELPMIKANSAESPLSPPSSKHGNKDQVCARVDWHLTSSD